MYMSDCNYFEGDSLSVKSSTFHNNKIRNAKKLTEVTKSPMSHFSFIIKLGFQLSYFIYNQAKS